MASQLYATNSLGGYLSAPELSQKLRVVAQPLKRFLLAFAGRKLMPHQRAADIGFGQLKWTLHGSKNDTSSASVSTKTDQATEPLDSAQEDVGQLRNVNWRFLFNLIHLEEQHFIFRRRP